MPVRLSPFPAPAGRPCRDWPLVFDNAEELETVRPFFPTGGPGRILVTFRNAQWSRAARTVEVDVFGRKENVDTPFTVSRVGGI